MISCQLATELSDCSKTFSQILFATKQTTSGNWRMLCGTLFYWVNQIMGSLSTDSSIVGKGEAAQVATIDSLPACSWICWHRCTVMAKCSFLVWKLGMLVKKRAFFPSKACQVLIWPLSNVVYLKLTESLQEKNLLPFWSLGILSRERMALVLLGSMYI